MGKVYFVMALITLNLHIEWGFMLKATLNWPSGVVRTLNIQL